MAVPSFGLGMNESVFVCYSRKDEGLALKLADRLKKRSVNIWIDQWNIEPLAGLFLQRPRDRQRDPKPD